MQISALLKMSVAAAGAGLLSLSIAPSSWAAVIFSDNFNAENGGTAILNYAGFSQWNVADGTVDLLGVDFYDPYPGNGLYVDLDGSTADAGVFSTKSLFDPGNYLLSFKLGGSSSASTEAVTVSFGSFSEVFNLASNAPLTTFVRSVNLTGASVLSFSNAGGDYYGSYLDDVSISTSTVPIPTPALLPGLIGLGVAALRRKQDETAEENA